MLTAVLDSTNILNQFLTTDNKVFTYTPTTELTKGAHTLSITVQDDQGVNTLASSSTFTVNPPTPPAAEFPWLIIIIIAIVIIIVVALLIYMRSQAYI